MRIRTILAQSYYFFAASPENHAVHTKITAAYVNESEDSFVLIYL